MATFVHIGDFHAAPGPRNADRYRVLDHILTECEACTVSAWLWPGDLSHQRQAIEDKNALAVRLREMASRAPVILVYGNHDLPGDLDVFAHLQARYPIAVVSRPECVRLQVATGEMATIFCLPYPTKGGLVAQGVIPADVVEVGGDALEPIFMRAAYDLDQARRGGDLTLMVGHINVAGSITSTGQPNIGREIELSPRHLERLGPIYKGLNHIHKAQTIAGAHYAGSVCRLDWGEVDPKRYLAVTVDDGGVLVQSCAIEVPPMFHVEGELTREGFRLSEVSALDADIERRYHAGDWAGCEVRVRFRYRQSERDVLDESLVRTPFADGLRLKVEGVAVPDRAVRAPAVAAALTLAGKVAAWAEVVDITPAPTLVEKLARLEQTEPAALVAAVSAELAELAEEFEEAVA